MKRLFTILCIFLLLPSVFLAEEREAMELPIYYSIATTQFYLRSEIDSQEKVAFVDKGYRADIYEISGEWCRVACKGQQGWCKLRYLNVIKSLNIQKEPQYQAITGQKFTLLG